MSSSSPGSPSSAKPGALRLERRQRGVAEATATALGDHQLGAGADQVGEDGAVAAGDDGAVGDREHQVGAVAAVAVAAGAVATVLGLAVRAVVVVDAAW